MTVLFQLDEIIIEEFRAGAERRCQPGSTASRFTARTATCLTNSCTSRLSQSAPQSETMEHVNDIC
jgi:hypothetical protein